MTTQPTSIDEVLNVMKHYWYHAGDWHVSSCVFLMSDSGVCNCQVNNIRIELKSLLKEKLTTLVEQARGQGREEAVRYVAEHSNYHDASPEKELGSEIWFHCKEEVLAAARTISSDKK